MSQRMQRAVFRCSIMKIRDTLEGCTLGTLEQSVTTAPRAVCPGRCLPSYWPAGELGGNESAVWTR